MAIDFDHVGPDGGPVVTSSIDFDTMTEAQIAAVLGLDSATGARFHALTGAMAGIAHDQATLDKLGAALVSLAVKAIGSGIDPIALLGVA